MDEGWLQLYIHETEHNEKTWGVPVFDEELFYEKNPEVQRPRQELNATLGRYLQVNDTQTAPERFNSKAFNWTIYEYKENRMAV